MNPKSGKAGIAILPAEPDLALEADLADPGEIHQLKAEQFDTGRGKYGSASGPALRPPETETQWFRRQSWIEIELVDDQNKPVPGEKFRVICPDGAEATGTLDQNGFARVDFIEAGDCQISFPELDKGAVKAA